jgi:HPt (histidine-containing phosphotransfer) domain-containing protein
MTDNAPTEKSHAVEIQGTPYAFVDEERLTILTEALGKEKLAELCFTARQSILESAEELRLNWQKDDARAAGRSAHRLVGVAANFGWPALAEIASHIERACQNNSDGKQYTQQFEEILTASLAAVPNSSNG